MIRHLRRDVMSRMLQGITQKPAERPRGEHMHAALETRPASAPLVEVSIPAHLRMRVAHECQQASPPVHEQSRHQDNTNNPADRPRRYPPRLFQVILPGQQATELQEQEPEYGPPFEDE